MFAPSSLSSHLEQPVQPLRRAHLLASRRDRRDAPREVARVARERAPLERDVQLKASAAGQRAGR